MSAVALGGWLLAALLLRVAASALVSLPDQDGVSYLWMAEQFAAGEFAAPLGEVFPPLLALVIAPFVALGLEPFRAGQLVLAIAGTLAILPCARLMTQDHVLRAGPLLLAVTLGLPIRFGAEIYTEPMFLGCSAAGLLAGIQGRAWQSGAWSAVAFWLRPEALALPLGLWLADRRRWPVWVLPLVAVLLLAVARGIAGHGFDPLPKLAFHEQKLALGDGGDPDLLPRLMDNLALLPGAWLEAFQLVGLLAVVGCFVSRGARARDTGAVLLIGLAAILVFVMRRRFLVAWTPCVLVFAFAAITALRPVRLQQLVLLLAAAIGIWVGLRPTDPDKAVERDVGAWLAAQLPPGERVEGDLPRVLYFAGQRPPPPRHRTIGELVEAARDPAVRFFVLGIRREQAAAVATQLAEYRPVTLPFPAERIQVWRR